MLTRPVACTLCHTELASGLRAALLQADAAVVLLQVGAALGVLAAVLALAAYAGRRR
jgi:hypothetical protein